MYKRLAVAAFFVAVAVAALGPIRSYDAFWHFATGHWIVSHHALPLTDPLAVASAKVPWINGEWLWQVIAYAVLRVTGLTGMSWFTALVIAGTFAMALWFAAREQGLGIATVLAAAAFAGASDRLGVRPLTAAALLVVVALGLLAKKELALVPLTVAYAFVTVVWINIHPSALLAPLLALATLLIDVRRWRVAVASALALLVNPFGWHAVDAPLTLTSFVNSGEFVNAEWTMSPATIFPLLYASVAVGLVWFAATPEKRVQAWRFILFAGFAFLAIRHVRNQALYFAALPLLLPPVRKVSERVSNGFILAAVIPIAWVLKAQDHDTGVDAERFPVRAVARLAASGLKGNIYNVDQFGGFLEWTFYPERRVLTDGRNELFRKFIAEDFAARSNNLSWHALLTQYGVDLAVDEYSSRPIEVINAQTGERQQLPQSVVRYRQREWALIAFDDAAMIFARRAAFPPEQIASLEYFTLVPDAPGFGLASPRLREIAQREVARARREIGNAKIVQALDDATR